MLEVLGRGEVLSWNKTVDVILVQPFLLDIWSHISTALRI